MFNFGILWLNARNLRYIKKHNPKKQIRFVHDKSKTKDFLWQRGIPVPKTYKRILNRQELFETDFSTIWNGKFVIKPNRWSKWNGIFIVKWARKIEQPLQETIQSQKQNSKQNLKNKISWHKNLEVPLSFLEKYTQKALDISKNVRGFFAGDVAFLDNITPHEFLIGKQRIDDHTFKQMLFGILDGQYTLWHSPDTILVEETLIAGSGFDAFCTFGLADIRVVLFNLVPIAAMLRMPTPESWGKANLAQWGIGFGIDMGTWAIQSMFLNWTYYKSKFLPEYKHFHHKIIPYRNDILLYSSNAQYFVNMWYIWVDWVITEEEPKLLEVNGRVGIEIQNITQKPLAKIMEKIHDIKIKTPEKWVEIAKSLFTNTKSVWSHTKILFLSQKALLQTQVGPLTKQIEAIAVVNPQKKRTYVSTSIAKKLWNLKKVAIHLPDSTFKITTDVLLSKGLSWNKISLWANQLQDVLIKSVHKTHAKSKFFGSDKIFSHELDELQIFDQKLHDLYKRVNLKKCLKPSNYLEEFDMFVSHGWKYDPIFTYVYPKNNIIALREDERKRITDTYPSNYFASPFATILYQKLDEIKIKIWLVWAYKKQDLVAIETLNQKYYWSMNKKYLQEAINKIKEPKGWTHNDMWQIMGIHMVYPLVKEYLEHKKMPHVEVLTTTTALSRIAVLYKKGKPFIRLLSNTRSFFREKELDSKLVHEVDVHLTRYLNAQKTWRHIFQKGTAWYITDEEGLAIWMSEKYLQSKIPAYVNYNIYRNYIYLYRSKELSFQDLVSFINETEKWAYYSWNKLLALFNRTLKFKKWIQQTHIVHPWTAYIKDKVYLDWYKIIQQFVQDGWDIQQLMLWKIKVSDIWYIF